MSKPGFLMGFAGAGILSAVLRFVGYLIKILSTVMLYFGLYIPFFYFLYGLIINLTLGVALFDLSVNSQLYLLGLLLCLVSSVIITVRNIVLEPIKSALKRIDNYRAPEQPIVYRSELMPDLIIHEYSNRYDVYRDVNGYQTYLRTERKGRGY